MLLLLLLLLELVDKVLLLIDRVVAAPAPIQTVGRPRVLLLLLLLLLSLLLHHLMLIGEVLAIVFLRLSEKGTMQVDLWVGALP
mmetsp:Transcript_23309/g.27354  ORF Transcript_23309/g.27354 Transcript_23309/m.27354 type:complete len:84 (+) Transcript_23309:158-409(+)